MNKDKPLWFTSKFDGLLGVHREKIEMVRIGPKPALILKDGTEYLLHPDHAFEAVNTYLGYDVRANAR